MSESRTDRASDAAKVAGGGGITFAGILTDRGLRFVVVWLLTHLYGPDIQGEYAFVVQALVPTIAGFASLGLDTGIIYFGARYRKLRDQERLKGVLLLGALLAALSSIVTGLIVWRLPDWICQVPALTGQKIGQEMCTGDPEIATQALWGGIIAGLWIPLLFLIGALRAHKDMKSSALAFQVVLPLTLLTGVGVAWLTDSGLSGLLAAYAAAAGAAVLAASRFAWRRYGALLTDRTVRAKMEPGALLRFSIPQTLASMVFRLNMRMDLLMLKALAGSAMLGFYSIAAGLAVLGALPVNAIISIFNPYIAERVSSGETEALDAMLKTVTRWLIMASLPVYTVLILLSDVLIGWLYPAEYSASVLPLVVLCAGQIVNVACSPTMRLIPMSGHTMLNLINGLIALALGIALNLLLIPTYGILGAALATAITLAAWGLWRVVEVWHLLRCFPFTVRSGGLLLGTVAGLLAVHITTHDATLPIRLMAVAALLLSYAFAVRQFLYMPEDQEILERVGSRIRKRTRRSG